MRALESIADIRADERELLEAAGYLDLGQLAKARPDELVEELEKANEVLEIVAEVPERERVLAWIKSATKPRQAKTAKTRESRPGGKHKGKKRGPTTRQTRQDIDPPEEAREEESAGPRWVNFEAQQEVQEMIARAPMAIRLPARLLREQQILPASIGEGTLLSHAQEDLDMRVHAAARPRSTRPEPRDFADIPAHSNSVVLLHSNTIVRKEIDKSRVRQMDELMGEAAEAAPVKQEPPPDEDDRLHLLRTAREKTNRGKKTSSRRYVRGLLHDRKGLVVFSSILVLVLAILMPVAVIFSVLLVLSDQVVGLFDWVPQWVLIFPAVMPVLGLLYFLFCLRVKCRVCGQKLFVPRSCHKHVKAHHLPGMGYIVPLAFHALLFHWFYCTFCGTANRIRE